MVISLNVPGSLVPLVNQKICRWLHFIRCLDNSSPLSRLERPLIDPGFFKNRFLSGRHNQRFLRFRAWNLPFSGFFDPMFSRLFLHDR